MEMGELNEGKECCRKIISKSVNSSTRAKHNRKAGYLLNGEKLKLFT